jgi:hypothetical protein
MWPLRVLSEQPSLAAPSARVLSPSGVRWCGLRAGGRGRGACALALRSPSSCACARRRPSASRSGRWSCFITIVRSWSIPIVCASEQGAPRGSNRIRRRAPRKGASGNPAKPAVPHDRSWGILVRLRFRIRQPHQLFHGQRSTQGRCLRGGRRVALIGTGARA